MKLRRVLALAGLLVAACTQAPKPVAPLAQSGELVVLTVNGPSTYFEDAQGLPSGFEYDLVNLFARELNVRPVFQLVSNPADIDDMLRAGRAHMAAAALARRFDFPGGLAWGPSYLTTQHEIVGRLGESKPRSLGDIAGQRVGVVEESVGEYVLAEDPKVASVPLVRMPPGTSTLEMLQEVAQGRLDYALVESTRFTLARRFFPQIDVAFNVGKPVDYAWLVSTVDKKKIMEAAKPFFERIRKDGTLKRLVDRYYGHALRMNSIDSGALLEKIPTVLPKLKPFFQEAEEASGVDWRLLAAIGYQESHWDASATSPTGVRGLMMLTDDTADRLQVKNRLDPRDSILGGAKYFALVRESLPGRIDEPDRTFLALAAYNIGLGHLEDARILAQRAKLNPDKWQDIRQVLNQLAEPDVFTTLKQGYARGFEAIQFVDNIRNYYDVISLAQPRDQPLMPTLPPDQPLDTARLPTQLSSKALPAGK
jgi:membrane-bound lytic murein transglycosylase F